MTVRAIIAKMTQQDHVNFLLTNRIPRRLTTRLMGWFSRIENPVICAVSLGIWQFFADLDLNDAREQRFRSMHACFTRQLKDGARPIEMDPETLVSPCDGIIGATGRIEQGQLLQVKGSAYALSELLGDGAHAESFAGGCYVTLRLTSGMYHHFHAPQDCRVWSVTHIPGDRWNVNPIALRRVDKLFCRNERAVIRTTLSATGHAITLVPVAAILVAGIRLRFLDMSHHQNRKRQSTYGCDVTLRRGDAMGWFEHGSTVIVLAPAGCTLPHSLHEGATIRMGQQLMRLPARADGGVRQG